METVPEIVWEARVSFFGQARRAEMKIAHVPQFCQTFSLSPCRFIYIHIYRIIPHARLIEHLKQRERCDGPR